MTNDTLEDLLHNKSKLNYLSNSISERCAKNSTKLHNQLSFGLQQRRKLTSIVQTLLFNKLPQDILEECFVADYSYSSRSNNATLTIMLPSATAVTRAYYLRDEYLKILRGHSIFAKLNKLHFKIKPVLAAHNDMRP